MPQLNIYVPEKLARTIRSRAKAQGKSLSEFVTSVLKEKLQPRAWDKAFFKEVMGGAGKITSYIPVSNHYLPAKSFSGEAARRDHGFGPGKSSAGCQTPAAHRALRAAGDLRRLLLPVRSSSMTAFWRL